MTIHAHLPIDDRTRVLEWLRAEFVVGGQSHAKEQRK
jgi:hypothetical protein